MGRGRHNFYVAYNPLCVTTRPVEKFGLFRLVELERLRMLDLTLMGTEMVIRCMNLRGLVINMISRDDTQLKR